MIAKKFEKELKNKGLSIIITIAKTIIIITSTSQITAHITFLYALGLNYGKTFFSEAKLFLLSFL